MADMYKLIKEVKGNLWFFLDQSIKNGDSLIDVCGCLWEPCSEDVEQARFG